MYSYSSAVSGAEQNQRNTTITCERSNSNSNERTLTYKNKTMEVTEAGTESEESITDLNETASTRDQPVLDDIQIAIISLIVGLLKKQIDICAQLMLSSQSNETDNVLHNLLIESLQVENLRQPQDYKQWSIPRLQPDAFKHQFRITTTTFEILALHLGRSSQFDYNTVHGGRVPVPVPKAILISLWVLGNQDSYRMTSERFNVTQSTVHRSIQRVCSAILELLTPKYINWPHVNEQEPITVRFLEQFGFPQTIGAINTILIPIDVPKDDVDSYFNGKGYHSVILQAICDADSSFLHCYAGCSGGINNIEVLENSDIHNSDSVICAPGYHLVGDNSYPLKPWLQVPFLVDKLTEDQERFNQQIAAVHSVVHRAFALLKRRFRRLSGLNMRNLNDLNDVIITVCTLHNICLEHEDFADGWLNDDVAPGPQSIVYNEDPEGEEKRTLLMAALQK